MTIGSDQLDAWGRTLIEADELYREVQLLIRINPEAYTVDSTALAAVGVANADAYDDGGMDHPIAFARRWAWHLAAEKDRKSTRLNSSHVSISYAVFCLKKQN